MTAKKYTLIQAFFVLCIIVFSIIDVYMYFNGYFEAKKVTLKYQENNDIDYKVYLKKNDFFETKYLGKDETYITSLIDHINADFNYKIDFDALIDGKYTYYVYATVESNKSNGQSKYWSKDYRITDEKKIDLKKSTGFSVHENVDIDYNKYNNILLSFKKTLGLSGANGILKVYFVVNSEVEGNEVSTPIESKLLLALPLSEQTIEAKVDLDAHNTVKEVSKVIDADKARVSKVLGTIYAAAIVFLLALIIYVDKKKKNLNKYESTLKKILNTYDGIIVNINKIPDLTGFRIIDVSSFEELLDAHGEVRMPINFYRGTDKCYFILISDKTAWKYKISRMNIQKVKI